MVNQEAGRLLPRATGFSAPVSAPLYTAPPHYYRGFESLAVDFETDGNLASDLLPEGLVLLDDPCHATLKISRFPMSSLGSYSEALLSLPCQLDGRPYSYCVGMFCTGVVGLIAGREVWGAPKLLGDIEWGTEQGIISVAINRPAGVEVARISVRPERLCDPEGIRQLVPLYLKMIPSPEIDAPAEVCELVEIPLEVSVARGADGVAQCLAGSASVAVASDGAWDPWGRLPVGQITRATWSIGDMTVPHGRVVRRY